MVGPMCGLALPIKVLDDERMKLPKLTWVCKGASSEARQAWR
jgi:hypothetical protein